MLSKILFFVGILLAATGVLSPAFALAAGLLYGFLLTHAFHAQSASLSKFLLKASVVALGFAMNLGEVVKAGRSGFVYTAAGIVIALVAGTMLGRLLKVARTPSFLICAGTAICGGSAIAAVGPVMDANEEDMAVSLATVFVLNSIALFLFPTIGERLHLTQTQFGLWAALAIHDTSSVVGAAARYGPTALAVGTTVKLARALWIAPVTLLVAVARRSRARIQWPWFIALFCLAATLNTWLPGMHPVFGVLSTLGRLGLGVTLFLIGTGISPDVIRQTGARPLVQGVALWALVATASLLAIETGYVRL